MKNILKFCQKYLKGKNIDYKIRFAKKIIEGTNISINNAYAMVDYIIYKDYQEKDREISSEEIDKLYSLIADIDLMRELQKPNYGISPEKEKEFKNLMKHRVNKDLFQDEKFWDKLEKKRQNFYIKRGENI